MKRIRSWCVILAASLIAIPAILAQAQETQELSVKESDRFGKYLADADGRTVYAYTADSRARPGTPATSRCYDACADAWPPLEADQSAGATNTTTPGMTLKRKAVQQQPGDLPSDIIKRIEAARELFDPALMSTTEREDGVKQVTYAGRPLYYYEKDTEAGQTLGQGVEDAGGEWFLLAPDGSAIKDEQ